MPRAATAGRLTKHKGRVASIAPGLLLCALTLSAQAARAADECGADGPGADVVTCTGGTFADGITYTNSDGLTLVLEGGTSSEVAGSDRPAVLLETDTTTTQDVSIIARDIGTLGKTVDDGIVVRATNQGFGAATVVMENGTVLSTAPGGRSASGLSAQISNPDNTRDTTATLTGGRIEVTGEFSAGLSAINAGSGDAIASVTGGTIQTTSASAPGVYAVVSKAGSTAAIDIEITGGSISTTGSGGSFVGTLPHAVWGLSGTRGDVSILLEDGDITTTGRRAFGVLSEVTFLGGDNIGGTNTMSATMTGGSIHTAGEEAYGLAARNFLRTSGADARTRMEGGTITTLGADTAGVLASSWGEGFAEAIMTGGEITSSGTNGKGIHAHAGEWASGQFARAALSGGTITTSGDGGHGIHARSEIDARVLVDMTGGAIRTTGAQAHGIFADRARFFRDDGIDVQITDGTIQTSGTGAHGVYALNMSTGVTKVLTATDITASGTDADAIRIDARAGTFDLDVTAGRVSGGAGFEAAAIQNLGALGGTIDIHAGAVVETPSGLNAIRDGDGATQMRIAGTLNSGIDAGAGDDSITFTATSRLGSGQVLLGDGADSVIIESGADLSGLFGLHGGAVGSDPDIWTDHLTIRGDIGTGAPRTLTGWEALTIDGGRYVTPEFTGLSLGTGAGQGLFVTNGATFVIKNVQTVRGNINISADSRFIGGGAGGTGLSSGFYYLNGTVQNAGMLSTQNADAGDQTFIRGAYGGGGVLALDVDFENAIADTLSITGDVTAPGTVIDIADVSQGAASGAQVTLITVDGASTEGDFVLSGGAVQSGAYSYELARTGTTWQLTPGLTAAAGAYQSAGYVLGAFAAGTESIQGISPSQRFGIAGSSGIAQARGAWVQASATRFDAASTGSAPITLSGTTQRLQFGFETQAESNGAEQWIVGLTGQIGSLSASTRNSGGSSRISADAIGIGASATWYGPGGLYVDTSAQVNRLSVDYAANGAPLAADETVMTYGVNVELGQRIALSPSQTLVPQVALHWAHIGAQDFTDTLGNPVRVDGQDRLIGRFGLAYEFRTQNGAGGSTVFYAKGSLLHDFNADSGATVAGTALSGAFDDTWGEIGIGASHNWDGNRSAFADVSYRHGVGSSGSAVSVNAGLTFVW